MKYSCAQLIPKRLRASRLCSGFLFGCVLLIARPQSGFAFTLAATEGIDLKGKNIETDSYDSRTPAYSTGGRYDPAKRKAGGDLVASVNSNLVLNLGNATVAGHLVVGPAASVKIGGKGTVGDLSWITNMTGIEPGCLHTDMQFSVSSVADLPYALTTVDSLSPFGAGGSGTVDGTNYDHVFTVNGSYAVSDNGTIYVGTNAVVRMRVDNASFGPERIFVAAGGLYGTWLSIWVAGTNLSLSANYIVQSGNARDLSFQALPACTTVTFKGDGDFVGTLYAPDSDFQLESGRIGPMNFTGHAVAKNITVKGEYHFHSDEAFFSPMFGPNEYREAVVGETVEFGAFYPGAPFKIQWQFEGVDIPGATSTVLTLTNVQLSSAGEYNTVFTEPTFSFSSGGGLVLRVFASGAASLQSPVRVGDEFRFKVSGVFFHRYRVEASTNLTDWTALRTNISPFTFVEPNATAPGRRFYRAVFVPQL
jgi:Putative Ice-binding-like adhesive domain